MRRLEGTVAVVTGGNIGIGGASAKRLKMKALKWRLPAAARKRRTKRPKCSAMSALAIQADVSRIGEIDKIFSWVKEKFGNIGILFVNAGMGGPMPLAETRETIYDEILSTNFKGAYFTIQKALPHLNDDASIILNTSIAGSKGIAGTSVYSATKPALRSRASAIAAEVVGRGIRIDAVAPDPIATLFLAGLPPQKRLNPSRRLYEC